MNYFRTNLKFLRKSFGITQPEIAAHVNKLPTTISNWENGLSEPSMEELIALSKFFDVRLDILILVNIQKANLITEQHVAEFAKKKKLKTNKIDYDTTDQSAPEIKEPNSPLWQVLDELKVLNNTVGKLTVEMKKKRK